ncbi:MAG: UbiX family flavin prenyltransferase [Thermoleophilia bacterium]|nr:UbiX family flavin prenyltransferase [Thermoleophilia bacterium]MDH3725834.1 UbiX family flavin prenyltransferase [Thermoleophilia bacterium]
MRVFLGVTGASGAAYGAHALRALTRAGCEVGLCISESGLKVIAHELFGLGADPTEGRDVLTERFVATYGEHPDRVSVLGLQELTAPFASGSALAPAALIMPCSGSTLGAIAHGAGRNLIHRCADVMIKERRTLVLVPRETPLSPIYLENLLTLSRAGATILPAMPGLYNDPRSVEDMIDFIVGKALDAIGVEHDLLGRWGRER